MNASRQVAVVTGGAQGIGLAIVERLAEDGFAVLAIDRNVAALEREQNRLAGRGLAVTARAADVTDRAAIKAALDEQPRVDVAVCAAGVYWPKTFRDGTEDDFRRMYEVNLVGVFITAQEAVKRMRPGGRVVFISSRGALGGTGFPHYVASKAAVIGLVRAMAMELRQDRIAVNSVAPGFTDTPMTRSAPPELFKQWEAIEPAGKAANPAEIANAVAFFASPRTSFVTGQTLFVDGGKSLGGLSI